MTTLARTDTAEAYLDLLARTVTNLIYQDAPISSEWQPVKDFVLATRERGNDWPSVAHTMVGMRRIENLRHCLDRVRLDGVPGDIIETGVWRGGTCIFARGYLRAHGMTDRAVWVADSFEGIPEVGEDGHLLDRGMRLHTANDVLGVSVEKVKANFERYGLLDEQVRFLPGWFRDTLPTAPISRLAVLRLDGDLYESTMDALESLYPKLSPGGYVIVDDYLIAACAQATHEFRDRMGITDEIIRVDDCAVYWRRSA
ncbi:TylF/MycF family methyltransferase [Actinokineospora sp. 24-640]